MHVPGVELLTKYLVELLYIGCVGRSNYHSGIQVHTYIATIRGVHRHNSASILSTPHTAALKH